MLGFSIIQSTNETWRKRSSHFLATSFFFFKTPIRSRSPLLTGSRLISLPLATQMFQFAKFEKSKERRLATELGYGFPIGDPWITDGISPWPFASESVLPSQCPGIHPMHSFRSCTQQENECALAQRLSKAQSLACSLRIGYTSGTLNTNPISIQKSTRNYISFGP